MTELQDRVPGAQHQGEDAPSAKPGASDLERAQAIERTLRRFEGDHSPDRRWTTIAAAIAAARNAGWDAAFEAFAAYCDEHPHDNGLTIGEIVGGLKSMYALSDNA